MRVSEQDVVEDFGVPEAQEGGLSAVESQMLQDRGCGLLRFPVPCLIVVRDNGLLGVWADHEPLPPGQQLDRGGPGLQSRIKEQRPVLDEILDALDA